MSNDEQHAAAYQKYAGLTAEPRMSAPLEREELRRFVQAIMDDDPAYYDEEVARRTKAGTIVAPPLYPLYSLRRPLGMPDPLQAVSDNPDHDGVGETTSSMQGLPPIPSPFLRRLNGGNDVEIYRYLKLGERAVAKTHYKSLELKKSKNGNNMLVVVIETRWETDSGELLMINRQTSIRR